ncbi:MAG: hypothetical protein ACRD3J_24070 [Thermoanaerobaculia bacterium]
MQERLGHSRISITLDTYSYVLPTMQRDAADKLDALVDTVRREVERESVEAANAAKPNADAAVPASPEKDWLQLGYSSEETAFCATDAERPNDSDSLRNPEWSHLDSNQGPPACESVRGDVRGRPLTSHVVDFTKNSRRR